MKVKIVFKVLIDLVRSCAFMISGARRFTQLNTFLAIGKKSVASNQSTGIVTRACRPSGYMSYMPSRTSPSYADVTYRCLLLDNTCGKVQREAEIDPQRGPTTTRS